MTDCTLFKPRITFPLCELLHYKILIETELPTTPWFPLMSEAAVNIKAGVTSLNWGQGVKLDNRLFVCGFLSLPLRSPGLGESTRGCERRAAEPPLTYHISQRETDTPMLRGHRKVLPEATDAANPPSNNSRTVSRVAVKSGESSLVVAVTGDVPGCRHWPEQMRIKSTSSPTTIYRFKAAPAETPAPRKEVILVYFHSVVPVPSSSCLLLKTYLFVKSVPPPRSHGLCPPPTPTPPPSWTDLADLVSQDRIIVLPAAVVATPAPTHPTPTTTVQLSPSTPTQQHLQAIPL